MVEKFGLYVILTDPVAGYAECARAAVETKIRYIQLRMKNAPQEEILKTARLIRKITAGTITRFIVNDDVHTAMAAEADGVHLGQDDMPLCRAKEMWTESGKIFGLSTHNEKQAEKAKLSDPSYIGVGPVFPTPAKAVPDPVLGLMHMGKIIAQSTLTTVAIGGIDKDNLVDVLRNGAINFCAVRAITQSEEPEKIMQELMHIWRTYFNITG